MAEAFPTVLRDPIEDTNTLLLGSEAPGVGASSLRRRAWARRPRTAGDRGARRRRGSEPRLEGGEVYTDDRAPVEWLIDRSILGYAND